MDQKKNIDKRPSRIIDIEDKTFSIRPKRHTDYNYGQLQYGIHEGSTKKLSLRTFFGNPQSEVFCMKFDETDKMIASGNSDGSIKVFNLQTGKLLWNLQGSTGTLQTPTTSLAWKPKSQSKLLYTANADGSLIIWNINQGQFIEKVIEQNAVLCLEFNSEGNKFVTAGKDYNVRVYDEETMKVELTFPPQEFDQLGHSNRIFTAKFLKDEPNILLTGGWDSTVLIWDIRDKKPIDHINGPNISGNSLDYKNGVILAGSYRNYDQLQLFDFKQRKKIRDISWSEDSKGLDKVYCYCAQFSKQPDSHETIMAGCTGDNSVKFFDAEKEYKPCASVIGMKEGIYSCDFSTCSNKFAFAGGEGVVYIMGITDTRD